MHSSVPMLLHFALEALILIIIAETIVSNLIAFGARVSPYHPAVRLLRSIVNPILNPIRRILPPPYKTGGWDLSPLIVLIILSVVQGFIPY